MIPGLPGPGDVIMLMLEQHLELISIGFALFSIPVVELIRALTCIREIAACNKYILRSDRQTYFLEFSSFILLGICLGQGGTPGQWE